MILIKKIIRMVFKIKSFEEIADEWLEYKKISIKKSTYYNYMFIIEKYLKKNFSNFNIKNINNYNKFIEKLTTTLSPKTVRDIVNVLKAILKYYKEEYDCNFNYNKINIPKLEKSNITILNRKEKNKLEKYCLKVNTLKTLGVIICLNTGMRIGEICALKWENIDLVKGNIYVKKTLQRVYNQDEKNSKIIIDVPKTECSIRTIPIANKLYNILLPLKKQYDDNVFFLTRFSL